MLPDKTKTPVKLFRTVLFLAVAHICCSDPASQQHNLEKQAQPGKERMKKPASNYPDTIHINAPAAIFYNPDSMQLKKIKEIIERQNFETAIHECFYQMKNARQVITKFYPGIKIIEISNARYLLFHKPGGGHEVVDLDQEDEFCGIFLFDGSQSPQHVQMMNIETELGVYFSPGNRGQPRG